MIPHSNSPLQKKEHNIEPSLRNCIQSRIRLEEQRRRDSSTIFTLASLSFSMPSK